MKLSEIITKKTQGIRVFYMTKAYEVLLNTNPAFNGTSGLDYSIGYGIGTDGEHWIGLTDINENLRHGDEELFFTDKEVA